MAARRKSAVEALLEREVLQSAAVRGGVGESCAPMPSGLNAVWRQKVIQWYFTLVAALRRQHSASAGAGIGGTDDADANPFGRSSVHVTASLLDGFLASLPPERASRYNRDRPAYQLLATTCLLLGMRLAHHDRTRGSGGRDEDSRAGGGGLKRAKTHRTRMNEAPSTSSSSGATTPPSRPPGPPIPNAAEILRISAAPKSISEGHILSMVREVTSARSFPRSRVVTAVDYVEALRADEARADEDGVALGPVEAEEALRLVDASLGDAAFAGRPPSETACAAVTLALVRSMGPGVGPTAVRRRARRSVLGAGADQVAAARAEADLLALVRARSAPSSRNEARLGASPVTHLIPLEEE